MEEITSALHPVLTGGCDVVLGVCVCVVAYVFGIDIIAAIRRKIITAGISPSFVSIE
jgi:hypothetical protein